MDCIVHGVPKSRTTESLGWWLSLHFTMDGERKPATNYLMILQLKRSVNSSHSECRLESVTNLNKTMKSKLYNGIFKAISELLLQLLPEFFGSLDSFVCLPETTMMERSQARAFVDSLCKVQPIDHIHQSTRQKWNHLTYSRSIIFQVNTIVQYLLMPHRTEEYPTKPCPNSWPQNSREKVIWKLF